MPTQKFVNIEGELFHGQTYWTHTTTYTLNERPHFDHTQLGCIGDAHPEAATSDYGCVVRESYEWGELWFPLPEDTEFIALGAILGVLRKQANGFDVFLQFGLTHLFDTPGIYPIWGPSVVSALRYKVPVGREMDRERALRTLRDHQLVYREATQYVETLEGR